MANVGSSSRRREGRISTADVKYIQRLRHALKIDDDTYAAMKKSLGVESTKDLSHAQYQELLRRIKGNGGASTGEGGSGAPGKTWKPMHKSAKKSGMDKEPSEEKKPLLGKIEALLADMSLPWSYADGISRQMFRVQYVRWCDPARLRKVVAALVYRQRREEAKQAKREIDAKAKGGQ
jgi:hypothetical protein